VVANPADHYTGLTVSAPQFLEGETLATLSPSVVYFLPEHAADPLIGHRNGTLFVEVTVPRNGPPRPLRFGTKVGNDIVPLANQ